MRTFCWSRGSSVVCHQSRRSDLSAAAMLKHCSQNSLNMFARSSLTVDDLLDVATGFIENISEDEDNESNKYCSSLSDTNSLDSIPSSRTIRVYTACLRPHVAYNTVIISPQTTSKEVIMRLLSKFKMKNRDPKLFYLTMEVTVSQTFHTILLEDISCLAEIISCNPWGGCKFILQSKPGVKVKIYDHQIRPDSVYKSIIISKETTVSDTLCMLWSCYPQLDCENLGLFEYSPSLGCERPLSGDQRLCEAMIAWREDSRLTIKLKGKEREVAESKYEVHEKQSNCMKTMMGSSIIQQLLRKKIFFRSMIGDESVIVEGVSCEDSLTPIRDDNHRNGNELNNSEGESYMSEDNSIHSWSSIASNGDFLPTDSIFYFNC